MCSRGLIAFSVRSYSVLGILSLRLGKYAGIMGGYRSSGPDLSSIRRSRGVSLEDIAARTKIGVFYLQAIESGNLGQLPGGIYTRSYVRQYAKAIDYDEDELLRQFMLTPASRRRSMQDPSRPTISPDCSTLLDLRGSCSATAERDSSAWRQRRLRRPDGYCDRAAKSIALAKP